MFILILFASVIVYMTGNGYGFVFDVEADEEFKPCPGKENMFIDAFLDISEAELFKVSELKLMINGTFKIIKDVEKNKPLTVTHIFKLCFHIFNLINICILLFVQIGKSLL